MSRKPKKCSECSTLFLPYKSIDKFCSPHCAYSSVTTEPIKGNPTQRASIKYKLPVLDKVFNKNKNEYKEEMIDDCGYLYCEHCKKSGLGYEAHHIIFRSEKPNHKHLHSKRNIYLLCKPCHELFHARKGLRNNIVVQRKLVNLFGKEILNKNT